MESLRVVVADDDVLLREGLASLLERSGFAIAGRAGDGAELLTIVRDTRPALVVGFADDRTLPAKLAREVAEAIPGAEYVEIERAGHFGYLEQPAEVNRVLVEFCERHRA